MPLKLKFEDVKLFFKEHGAELLSTCYVSSTTPLSYRCSCGMQSMIAFSKFKAGGRCKTCGLVKCAEKIENSSGESCTDCEGPRICVD